MSQKLVYSAPLSVSDSRGELVKDPAVLAALENVACLEGSVLDYLDLDIPEAADFSGGHLRLALAGKSLCLRIEINSPRKLEPAELSELKEDLDGQATDGLGEGSFDFVEEDAGLVVEIFPGGQGKSTLVQTSGEAWLPGKASAEEAANLRRCKTAAAAAKALEKKPGKKPAPGKQAKLDARKLFRLIQQEDKPGVVAEIASLGGDLGFIKSGQFPYLLLHDRALLKSLLDAGLNPNLHDREGQTLLWLAAGKDACVTLLLDRGANPNLRNTDPFQETALMSAAWAGDPKSVKVLLDHGADPSLKTKQGETALDGAKDRAEDADSGELKKLREVIQLLSKAKGKK